MYCTMLRRNISEKDSLESCACAYNMQNNRHIWCAGNQMTGCLVYTNLARKLDLVIWYDVIWKQYWRDIGVSPLQMIASGNKQPEQ